MKLPNVKGLVQVGRIFIQTNRPEILLGAAVTATIGSVVLAAKGGYEARGIVDEEIRRRDEANEQEPALTTKEKALLTWKCYTPAAVTTIGALGSISGLHIVHVQEKKALAAAALAAIEEVKSEAKRYEKELTSVLSDEERTDVQNRLAEKVVDPQTGIAPLMNSDGEIEDMYLVRDMYTGRDIWSNRNRIEAAMIEVNNVLNGSGDVELNHFYRHAGYGNIPEGYKVGWSGALVGLDWDTTVRDDGRPVRCFSFQPSPEKGFEKPPA